MSENIYPKVSAFEASGYGVSASPKFPKLEEAVLDYWKKDGTFQASINNREAGPHGDNEFVFYDGPPFANGLPHYGHLLTGYAKDLVARYQTQRGHKVERRFGWDTHGLPAELEAMKQLGMTDKQEILEMGIDNFNDAARASVLKYTNEWEQYVTRQARWVDFENDYKTLNVEYMESVIWAFKRLYDKGLTYQGFRVLPYCWKDETPLSNHELRMDDDVYQDRQDQTVTVAFALTADDSLAANKNVVAELAGVEALAWTTTPWTLPSNVALCVNPDESYVKVKKGDYTYIMAEALCSQMFGEDFEILDRFIGKDLEYREYEPLFDFVKPNKKAYYIVCDNYVTLTDGTGIVHTAPAFGEDDSRVGLKYDLPFVQLVDAKGEMTSETKWPGVFVKDADPLVLEDLDKSGKLFSAPEFTHSYPHCWRCNTPLLYYARESWYIKMTAVKEDLIKNNNTINWIPQSIGKGRFGDWLENIQDWAISRNRYWGTPLNIWVCECGHMHSIGSIEELKSMSDNCPDDIELHRPFIDRVTIKCPKCSKQMVRTPEVIDCWFDSGAMPFAQHHYPFENKEVFEDQFPADFISEAVDQTRGWFYSLLAVSTLLFNKSSYKNVIVLGHVQDENGQKMSKSKGNVVDPMEALNEYGADAIRWYFYVNSAPWLPNRFHGKAVTEGQRKFMGTLWNTYAFYVLYAEIDKFDSTKYKLEKDKLSVMDKWLLSKLNSLVLEVDSNLENYRITEAARALQAFVEDLSNWYVRRCRERFWAKGMEQDKINAYMTLYTALNVVCRLSAPMIPFITEAVYQNIVRSVDSTAPESIHLCDYPKADESYIDKELEASMDEVLDIVVLGRAARNAANIKNRQPVAKMYVKAENTLDKFYVQIVEEELNVKSVEFTDEVESFVTYIFKPQLKTVGPRYGKLPGDIKQALAELDSHKALKELEADGVLKLDIKGEAVELSKEDVLIETAQGESFISESNSRVSVVLDIRLTPELINEGFIRELISKVQTMRKEAGFEVTDHIVLSQSGNEKIAAIIKANVEMIKSEVLADEIRTGETEGFTKEWNLNGEHVILSVSKVN